MKMDIQEVRSLLTLLKRQSRIRACCRMILPEHFSIDGATILISVSTILVCVTIINIIVPDRFGLIMCFLLILAWVSFCIIVKIMQTNATQTLVQLIQVLKSLNDIRIVGVLTEALNSNDPDLSDSIQTALIYSLSSLREEDTGYLDKKHLAILYHMLRGDCSDNKADIATAILKALKYVGDVDAKPYVERLAADTAWMYASLPVRQAAQECLPFLLKRIEQTRTSSELLRASSASNASSDVLLRPASGVIESDPETLLRACDKTNT